MYVFLFLYKISLIKYTGWFFGNKDKQSSTSYSMGHETLQEEKNAIFPSTSIMEEIDLDV